MVAPNPPPSVETITKDARGRQVFDRWLYQFWVFATGGNVEDINFLIAAREFTREPRALPNLADSQQFLATRVQNHYTVQPTLGLDAQRILEGQIFGG